MAMSSGDRYSIQPEQRALLVIAIPFSPGLGESIYPFFDTCLDAWRASWTTLLLVSVDSRCSYVPTLLPVVE